MYVCIHSINPSSLPVVHLDKLYWLPNWEIRPSEEFDSLLEDQLKKDEWIIDGNYDRTFELRLRYADLCIFLDYDTQLCIQSVIERVEKYKGTSRPDMTEGCNEQADEEFIVISHFNSQSTLARSAATYDKYFFKVEFHFISSYITLFFPQLIRLYS